MAGLRLDLKDEALAAKKRGAAVVPKDPESSLLYKRIAEPNAARRMPPPAAHKNLTKEQIALLKRWIEEGAKWQEHWAFQAPVKPKLPAVKNAAWSANPIDRFILAQLEAKGLAPAARADKRTLIRRVALDVTGLPPTPAEVQRFLADVSPKAYEHMVDRYLASPHYGEHRARFWLDAARYGDTHGIHIDNYREIWPYRDWVIKAFNRNQPFDQFTTEQLAGDLLPNPTLDQRIATGFHRNNVTTSEGGAIDDEYIEIYAKDRADTTGAVWLGLTVGCATCHDHKFDPISQKEFYALGAFFRNTPQKAMDGNVSDTPPILLVPHEDDRAEWDRVQSRLTEIRAEIRKRVEAAAEATGELPANPLGPNAVLEKVEKMDATAPFSVSGSFTLPEKPERITLVSHQLGKEKNRGWAVEVNKGILQWRLVGDDGRTIDVRTIEPLAPGLKYAVVGSYDGSRDRSGMTLYLNGREVFGQGRNAPDPTLPGSIAVEGKPTVNNLFTDFRMFNRVLTETEAAMLAGGREGLATWHLNETDDAFRKLAVDQATLAEEAREIGSRGAITHVMHERTEYPPTAHVLFRGAYDQKRDKVEATTPAVLPPLPAHFPRNRLGFAKWLFTDEHPLTARVTVNRMWQEIFGTGLVRTADDFGSQGEPPSNPELLDWLAIDFRESGWDVKRFYKRVVMSAAYRQAAVAAPAKLAKDPDNRLLSRGPRFRMDAEMVRDYALVASGLLAREIGGPSVRPYQPDGVWEAVAMLGSNTRFYKRDSGTGLYRRSMYTFWKRSAPPASMDIFNAPSRESCTMRRERTNTPLQALVTMNDEQFFEAARVLAEQVLQSTTGYDARVNTMAERVLGRPLTLAEGRIVKKAWSDFRSHYESHPADAKKLLTVGERTGDPSLDPAEFAAFTMVTNQLFNLDEVLNK